MEELLRTNLVAPQRGAAPFPQHLANRGLRGRLLVDH